MRHPHGETVTRLRAAPKTDPKSGQTTALDWSNVTELAMPRCAVDDSKSREVLDANRRAIVTDFVIWPDDQYDVVATDRLRVRGLICRIVGRPSTPNNPLTGGQPGMEIAANIGEA